MVRVVVVVARVVVVVAIVVVVGATVVVVVAGGMVVVVVVDSGTARLSMSCENPKAACRPAAAPIPGGSVSVTLASTAASTVVGSPSSASSLPGENAAKAAIARRAITTQVTKAKSLVNLTPVLF